MSNPTTPKTPPTSASSYIPSYILKLFIVKQSSCTKEPNPYYDELVERYKEKIEAHNTNIYESQYPDSGFDLFIPFDYSDHGNGYTENRISHFTFRAPLSVKCSMSFFDKTCNQSFPSGYYLYPRSSIVKTPFRLSNSVGIIDSGYRGEIMAVVDNSDNKNNDIKECIQRYMPRMTRMFQICSPTLEPFLVRIVDSEEQLGVTPRGRGGFGSTGV
jgi:dUTPase